MLLWDIRTGLEWLARLSCIELKRSNTYICVWQFIVESSHKISWYLGLLCSQFLTICVKRWPSRVVFVWFGSVIFFWFGYAIFILLRYRNGWHVNLLSFMNESIGWVKFARYFCLTLDCLLPLVAVPWVCDSAWKRRLRIWPWIISCIGPQWNVQRI